MNRAAKSFAPAAFVAAAAAILGVRFFVFISRYSVNLLYYDQWDFLGVFFGRDPGLAELFFLQHGPHREGVGLIADKFLYPLTRWNVRAEAFLIGGCILAAMLLALLLKKKLFGRIEYSDALIPAMFLTLAQHETLIGTPNPAYSAFPLVMLMLYALALLLRHRVARYASVLLLNFLLIYTGFGVFAGVITIGVFALECYRRQRGAALGLAIAIASMASFFVHYRFESAGDCFAGAHASLVDYPWFVALMFSSVSGIRSPAMVVTVLGAGLLAWAVYVLAKTARREDLTIAVLVSFSLLFSASAAAGRACMTLPEAAQLPRYTTLLIPALLGMYFYCLRTPGRTWAVVALAVILAPGIVHVSLRAKGFADGKRAWAECYRRTENIGYCDASTGFLIYPDPGRTRLKEKLDYLKERRLNLFAP